MGVSQNRFRMTFAGYDRAAVDRHLSALEEQNRAMATDCAQQARRADALAAELAELRAAHDALKNKFDRVCRTPVETDGLSERMLRMVELAHVEAAEIVQDARTRADRTRTAADEDARRLRRRYERKLAELDDRRAQLESEFAERMRINQEEFDERERAAAQRRRTLDEQSARRRQKAEQELGKALAARRAESERLVQQREAEAAERADAMIATAQERAAEMVARATARVNELEDVQDTLLARLRETREILSAVGDLTEPGDDEEAALAVEAVPEQRHTESDGEPDVIVAVPGTVSSADRARAVPGGVASDGVAADGAAADGAAADGAAGDGVADDRAAAVGVESGSAGSVAVADEERLTSATPA
ncbi:DivIVA domain-containing protein [Prauserella rugosa]|uniref:DivIVA protein n=1 Tax=Prauserella rugosa TaxID=43354 RepID=A0A660C9R9_9PSEU|nr:DivIVA domain-containing protein [Prauserella rugosa]TWH18617.1 DivIVA protein [Prauserella rugosa]